MAKATKKQSKRSVLAWHVLQGSKRLAWGDKREVKPGTKLEAEGRLSRCHNGMHAATTEQGAVKFFFLAHPNLYAGSKYDYVWLCRVKLSGEIIGPTREKYCARTREVVSMKKIRPEAVTTYKW